MHHLASTRRLTTRWQSFVLRLLLSVLCVVPCLLMAQPSHANADVSPSGLVLAVEDARIEANGLGQALARELGIVVEARPARDATRPSLHVVQLASGRVQVTLERPGKPRMERSTALPEAPEERVEAVALLAENLLRAEAEELLAALQQDAERAAASAPAASADEPQKKAARARAHFSACTPATHAFGADLLPGVGTSSTPEGRAAVRAFSFGLFGAYSGGVSGFSMASFVDIQRGSLCGVQLSGAVNFVAGQSSGLQASLLNYAGKGARGATLGLLNYVGGAQRGLALSLANLTLDHAEGLSAGLLNFTHGSVNGANLGLANVATSDMQGAQLGLANVAAGDAQGAQLGLANIAGGDASGLQAGLLNVASGDMLGAQLGLLNVAGGEARGLQLGLVNYAGKGQTPIGMISIVRKGRTDLDLWGPSESGLMLAGVRHGGKRVHNLYYVGARVGEHGTRMAGGLGIGVRALETGRFRLDVDALSTFIYRMHADTVTYQQGLRVPLTVMVNSWLGVMVAPSYQFYFNGDSGERSETSLGVSKLKTTSKMRIESFPGIAVGLRFELPSSLPRARWSRQGAASM